MKFIATIRCTFKENHSHDASGASVKDEVLCRFIKNGKALDRVEGFIGLKLESESENIELFTAINDVLGTLKNKNSLKSILSLGIDAMTGARWVQENKEKLCPLTTVGTTFKNDGYQHTHTYNMKDNRYSVYTEEKIAPLRRKGYVLDEGICFNNKTFGTDLNEVLNTIDIALAGGIIKLRGEKKRISFWGYEPTAVDENGYMKIDENGEVVTLPRVNFPHTVNTGEKIEARIQPAALLKKPIADMRSIIPSQYNDCDSIKSFSDNTLGGLFVDGDAHTEFPKL